MISIQNKRECCGCKACDDVCPKEAISFKIDEEGFWYPEVNILKCINCHLCEKVCPILHHDGISEGNLERPITFILQHKNVSERFNSTSGAAYPVIARYYLENGYYVAGHIFNEDYSVRGYVTNTLEELELLRKSKYLQSDMHGVYTTVKNLLKAGEEVLFSGCPCQIAAMKTFLGKDYEGLLTIDFTCMGIDSPLAFKKYIESMERIYGSKLAYFKSKSKETGWRDLTNKMIFENGRTYFGTRAIDPNLKATFLDILMRPACFECKFKGLPRISDITIGDYWHRHSIKDIDMDDNTGTSYYMANNKKGLDFLEHIKDQFRCEEKEVEALFRGNPYMFKSLPEPSKINRKDFYKAIINKDFKEVVDEQYKITHSVPRIKLVTISLLRALKRYHFNPFRYFRFLYYNVFCKKVNVDLATSLFLVWDSIRLDLKKGARIEVKGICTLGKSKGSKGMISLGKNASLTLDTVESEGSDLSILIGESAQLNIGYRTILAKGVDVSSVKSVKIGDFSYLGRYCKVTDNNDMMVLSDEKNIIVEPVIIGVHCLIGENSIITRGTTLGDEVIVVPNSIVKGQIPPRVVVSGPTAEIIKKNILWKK